MMKIKDAVKYLETIAPPVYQETYDNSGLLVGSPKSDLTGILITLDVTEVVIDEAANSGLNMIVAHHPLIFKGVKSITGAHWVERCIVSAIKKDIAIYAIHTNLDNVSQGVNAKIAEKLNLTNTKILSPKAGTLSKLVTFVPKENKDAVLEAMYEAGAGEIGNYDHCSFSSEGHGTFRPGDQSNPTLGSHGMDETVSENRLEVIFPSFRSGPVIAALNQSHPYEEVAYDLSSLDNKNQDVGSGIVGELTEPMETAAFLRHLKQTMQTDVIRHTQIHKDKVKKIAVCGGAGSFLLGKAKSVNADVFITGDFKYHEFFEADNDIMIADIGHYESEQFTKELLYGFIRNKFSDLKVIESKTRTNPVHYLF
ncbi:MAG: Nif3-like dinuclear metal center hexameric protein [Cyclobacteriaceae bacterium]